MFSIRTVPDRPHGIKAAWFTGLIALFFPEKCPCCRNLYHGEKGKIPGLCPECAKDIQWVGPPFCPRCNRPFNPGTDSHWCSDCLRGKPFFDQARAVVLYQGNMAKAIQRFKYHGDITLANSLGWFWNIADLTDLSFELIVPVPLHHQRLRERGFNQALVLGKILSKKMGKKISVRALRRIRHTIPQVQLDHSERERNVRGAFEVKDQREVKDKTLLLIDDVFTTGATVNECAKVLKKSGAKSVFVLTLARVGVE